MMSFVTFDRSRFERTMHKSQALRRRRPQIRTSWLVHPRLRTQWRKTWISG